MSEYQYYEFLAVDRPLSPDQMAELRKLTTRAEISPTRLQNVYHWGDFKGDPLALMEQYFDAHVYVTNWGTRQLLLGFPRSLLDLRTAKRYEIEPGLDVQVRPERVILEFLDEDPESEWEDTGEGWMAALIPLRAEIANGDRRALYLGWLHCAGVGELDDDAVEPAVPPGLGQLSAPLKALAEFLRLDSDLVAVAAEGSGPLDEPRPSSDELERWIRGLAASEKDPLLFRLARGEPHLQAELLRRYRETTASADATGPATVGGRTVGELVAAAEARAEQRRRAQAEHDARERARRQAEQARARAAYLDSLLGRETERWGQVAVLVETKRPQDYDRAVQLLVDLRDVAARSRQESGFRARLDELRARHAKKPSLLARLDRAGLRASAAGIPEQ